MLCVFVYLWRLGWIVRCYLFLIHFLQKKKKKLTDKYELIALKTLRQKEKLKLGRVFVLFYNEEENVKRWMDFSFLDKQSNEFKSKNIILKTNKLSFCVLLHVYTRATLQHNFSFSFFFALCSRLNITLH